MEEGMLANVAIMLILTVLIVTAVIYLWKQKKQGATCIGCSCAKQCQSKAHACSCDKK